VVGPDGARPAAARALGVWAPDVWAPGVRALGVRALGLWVLGLWMLGGALGGALGGCHPSPPHTPPQAALTPRQQATHRLPVQRLYASADGGVLATLDGEALHLWRLPDLDLFARVEGVEGLDFATRVALSMHGHQVAVWGAGTLWLWPDQRGRARPFAPEDDDLTPQHLIGFDPSGALLWVSARGEVMRRADAPQRIGSLRSTPFDVSGDAARGFLLWGLDPAWLRCDGAAEGVADEVTDGVTDGVGGCGLEPIQAFWGRWQPSSPPAGVYDAQVILAPRGPEVMPLDLRAQRMIGPLSSRTPASPFEHLSAFALSPDGRWLVTATSASDRLLWWSLRDGQVHHVTALPLDLIDPLWPQPILDATFSDAQTLWVLLPEQRLLRYSGDGQLTGSWAL
jgi:hypothetical protein